MKFLVIVESPTKAKTINKYLGNSYIVKPSFGHIRDLSSTSVSHRKNSFSKMKKTGIRFNKNKILINRIGIDPYNGWLAKYEILPGKEAIMHELNILAKTSDHIYLATDLDREGEAIAWHLKEVIEKDENKISRVIFNEITYKAITQAFKNPTVLNINKVHAQQARRFMDRLVGYMLSPLLWKKIARGLSAGRVQSVAVRLIVDRERKIKKFLPKEYWELHAILYHSSGKQFVFQVVHDGISRFAPNTQEEVQEVKDILLKSVYTISDRSDKFLVNSPSAPFITSTLQQASCLKLGYSIKKTMLLAQRLYEAGYITYIRTNSVSVNQDALASVRSYIYEVYGKEYLSEKVNEYISKSCIQEAHEAIRPSNINALSESMEGVDSNLRKLYHLIWCQFVASQMKPSKHIVITLSVQVNSFRLRARSHVCCFDGWRKIVPGFAKDFKEKNYGFSDFNVGEILILKELLSKQRFTKPPTRYNEASLVKELEKKGIGRPSTYVPIISTIQDRGYVYLHNSSFYATKIGEIVTDRLFENFYELMDYQFTANMENVLDRIADSQEEWKGVLDKFFVEFLEKIHQAEKDFKEGGMRPNPIVMTNIACSLCGKNMGIRTAGTGVFLSCEGYHTVSVLKNRCKNTINLIPDIENNSTKKLENKHIIRCKNCNSTMDNYFIDHRRKLHVCVDNPSCNGYIIEYGVFFTHNADNLEMQCEKCTHNMCLKFGRFGKYMSCSNLDCKNTKKVLFDSGYIIPQQSLFVPFPELLCKKSDAYFVLRSGKLGIFLSAHTFPQSRETRAPFVEELVRFRSRLPKNLFYLADAPIYDDSGNKTFICFDRKNRQQYIVSKKNGKLTNWKSFFINGYWKVVKKI